MLGSSGAGSHTDVPYKLQENRIFGPLFTTYKKNNFWFYLHAKEDVLLDTPYVSKRMKKNKKKQGGQKSDPEGRSSTRSVVQPHTC